MDWIAFGLINGLAGHSHLLDLVMVTLARFGPFLMALPMLILWFAGAERERETHRQLIVRSILAAALALGINQVIGMAYFRPRPFASHTVRLLLPATRESSFPSDHAAGSWALAWGMRDSQSFIFPVMTVLAVLIAIARVYVGVHYPLDVLGGILVGTAANYLLARLWPFIMNSPVQRALALTTRFPR